MFKLFLLIPVKCHEVFVYIYATALKRFGLVDGGFNGDTVCWRQPYNRVILGVWFTKIYLGLLNIYCQLSAVCSYESNKEGQLECIFWPTCFLLPSSQDLSHNATLNNFFLYFNKFQKNESTS